MRLSIPVGRSMVERNGVRERRYTSIEGGLLVSLRESPQVGVIKTRAQPPVKPWCIRESTVLTFAHTRGLISMQHHDGTAVTTEKL